MAKVGVTDYMARVLRMSTKTKGLPPGTLVFVGSQKMDKPMLRVMHYDPENLTEKEIEDVNEVAAFKDAVIWLNVDGVHEVNIIEKVGGIFNLSPILLEDVMHTGQRPKIVEFDDCLFLVLNMLRFDETNGKIISEQLSMVIGEKFLLTFQEQKGDVFGPVRDRIRNGRKRIRSSGPDFLAYTLLDVVTENYIHITEVLGEEIEKMEDLLIESGNQEVLSRINRYKKEVNQLRRRIRPLREVVNQVPKVESTIITKHTLGYWGGLQDQVMQANEAVDAYRDLLGDQLNLYHSMMSTKMNDVMKVLTIFSAIFIPLTFIAGIYGTNFDVLPELHYEHSYFVMLGVMFSVVIIMLIFFKRKNWF